MSFSSQVKEEISRHWSTARHCQIAELAAILGMNGHVQKNPEGKWSLVFQSENEVVVRKCFTLLKKTFNIEREIRIRPHMSLNKGNVYLICLENPAETRKVLQGIKAIGLDGNISSQSVRVDPIVYQKNCCKRAFIRGSFLASGSISDPEKFYHFEIVCSTQEKAEQIQQVIASFDIDAKIVVRKKSYVVYIKEGAQIVEILGIMEAGLALMNLENIRILKEMRNSVNRKVNCETANINKTVSAAAKQIEDIRLIEEKRGLGSLNPGLEQIARLRLEYPEATLKELGEMLSPAVGKSGVNHRLRKLSILAEELRGNKEELL